MPVWLIVLACAGWVLLGLLLVVIGWDFCRSFQAALDSPPPRVPDEDLEEENAALRERLDGLKRVAEAQADVVESLDAEVDRLKAKLLAAATRITDQSEIMSRRAEKSDEGQGWLVLSLKWSSGGGDGHLVWYRDNASGYTCDLAQAGRYTEEEARRNELEGVTMAVPVRAALEHATRVVLADDLGPVRESASRHKEATP